MRRVLALALSLGVLVGCANGGDGASPTPSSGGDDPVASDSDMVRPVGGDLRIGQTWYLLGGLVDTGSGSPATVRFEQASAGGQAAVNSWSAEYTADPDGALVFGAIASTLMAGPPEAMAAEQAYFEALASVDGYTAVQAGELYLFDGDRNVLVFSAMPPADEPTVPDEVRALAEQVVGMSEQEAQAAVGKAGYLLRVVARDGEQLPHTDDYVVSRINIAVVKGRVTEATVG